MNTLNEIIAKFPSRCAETNRHLIKGTKIFHDPIAKKAYHAESQTVKKWKEEQAKAGKETQAGTQPKAGKEAQQNDFIQDPGITDEDNWSNQLY